MGGTPLQIRNFALWVWYWLKNRDQTWSERRFLLTDFHNSSIVLEGGRDSIALSNWRSRRRYVCNMFDMDDCATEFAEKFDKKWTQEFIFDFGKSGSDSIAWGDSSNTNPKYGTGDPGLQCSETVSWYYYHYRRDSEGHDSYYAEFENITGWNQMADIYDADGRLYCYSYENGRWIWENKYGRKTTPKDGDTFFIHQSNGGHHAAMVLDWYSSGEIMTFIDGPAPVGIWTKDLSNSVIEYGDSFCIGKIPDND